MLDRLLSASLAWRHAVLLGVAVLSLLGLWSLRHLTIDAVPDITNVQVQVNTEAAGFTPLEVEQRLTLPLENVMAGLAGLDHTRSLSRYGLSQLTLVFEDGTDLHFARQQVAERLQATRGQLPAGVEPVMGPAATGLGEIFLYTVDVDTSRPVADRPDAAALRATQEWIVRPQLLQVRGVADVNTIGGHELQYVVHPDPARLAAYGIDLPRLAETLERANGNQGAGYVERNGQQVLLRVPGQLAAGDAGITQLRDIVVAQVADVPVRVGDVADVRLGHGLRTGAATQDGREVVLGTVLMRVGENSRDVARAVAERLQDIQSSLPPGVQLSTAYDRTVLVERTLGTVQRNLAEGALLVVVVLFVLLGNLRAALITAAVIPVVMLLTITGMVQLGISANLMSLGALDFGLIVDGAVIIVENCLRRLALAETAGRLPLPARLALVTAATREVLRPALFGVFIITAVYLPVFALDGVAGRMFHPMAQTVVMALCAAMLLSVTAVPAAIALFVKTPRVHQPGNAVATTLARLYAPLLDIALRVRRAVVLSAALLVLGCTLLAARLGSEFLPSLDEGDIAMHALRIPGTSLTQAVEMQALLEETVRQQPEVSHILAKIGTADIATDPMPPSVADNYILLKDRAEWPDPDKPKAQVVAELERAVAAVPGNNYEFTQPIQMRFNELLSGVRADVAVKVHGDDLDQLLALGARIESLVAAVPGARDVALEPVTGLPVLVVQPRREALARHGLDVATLQETVATAYGGRQVGLIHEGDRRHALVLRLDDLRRNNLDALGELPIRRPAGGHVPLREVADIELTQGPNQVNRENGKRRVVVTANVRERDLGSFMVELRQRIESEALLPPGYWIAYGGSYQQLQSANARLKVVVPLTLALVFGLLWLSLRSIPAALLIFSAVPLALCGGVLALWLRGIPLSISAAVGFIALCGIAVLNGLVLVSLVRERLAGTGDPDALIREAALLRLRPVIVTALVAALGFVPMAINEGIGSEVQRPLATVVIGGVLSSTLLTLLVLPALCRLFHRTLGRTA